MTRIAVLVSQSRHPHSGAAYRDRCEAAAVELALGISDATTELVHAGEVPDTVLREYLGMGVPRLTRIETPAGMDWVADVAEYLRREAPDIILAGPRSNGGAGSGVGPYLVAEALGLPILAHVVGLDTGSTHVSLKVQTGSTHMETYRTPLPVVLVVSERAPRPRASVHALRQKGVIARQASLQKPAARSESTVRELSGPARRLRVDAGGVAADPMRALLDAGAAQAGSVRRLKGLESHEAAEEIMRFVEAKLMRTP